ncbi:MAG: SMP-30/gluconolactonase/LRE family protein [Longimicrobiales bacterium]
MNGERATWGAALLTVLACGGDTLDENALVTPRVETVAGPLPAGSGGMEVDAAGNVYMADFGATLQGPPGPSVWRISPNGRVEEWATGLVGASGNAFSADGTLLQSNIGSGTVSRIAPDGTVSTLAEGLRGPVGIAMAPGDTALVVECGAGSIRKVATDGTVSAFVEADSLLQCPNGITRASDGNYYVANFYNGDVLRVTPEGMVTRFLTLPGANNGHILFGNGVLYVVARSAHRVYEVTLAGDTTLLAGSGERGLTDGPAHSATLSLTNDLALSPDGSMLYFNDVGPGEDGTWADDGGRTLAPVWVRRVVLR